MYYIMMYNILYNILYREKDNITKIKEIKNIQ